MATLNRRALDEWGRLSFDVRKVSEVVKELELTDLQIHQLHGFNLSLMLGTLVANNGRPKESYAAIRGDKERTGERKEFEMSFNHKPDRKHVELNVMKKVAEVGVLCKTSIVRDKGLDVGNFVDMHGLNWTYLLDVIGNRPVVPLSYTEFKEYEEEYQEMGMDTEVICNECDEYCTLLTTLTCGTCSKDFCVDCFCDDGSMCGLCEAGLPIKK